VKYAQNDAAFFATALCEIIGCFLPWLWLKKGDPYCC
jgi:drug/metabolite transporter superfamily protein YnfA